MQIRSVMTSYCLQLKSEKYFINDISGNIEAVFLKLGTINVHHKRNKMTPLVLLPWQLFRFQSPSAKKLNIPICNLLSEIEGPTWNRHSSHIFLTSIIRLGWVDGFCCKTKLRICVFIDTPPAAKLLSWQQH